MKFIISCGKNNKSLDITYFSFAFTILSLKYLLFSRIGDKAYNKIKLKYPALYREDKFDRWRELMLNGIMQMMHEDKYSSNKAGLEKIKYLLFDLSESALLSHKYLPANRKEFWVNETFERKEDLIFHSYTKIYDSGVNKYDEQYERKETFQKIIHIDLDTRQYICSLFSELRESKLPSNLQYFLFPNKRMDNIPPISLVKFMVEERSAFVALFPFAHIYPITQMEAIISSLLSLLGEDIGVSLTPRTNVYET
jgi:hypothetical protein